MLTAALIGVMVRLRGSVGVRHGQGQGQGQGQGLGVGFGLVVGSGLGAACDRAEQLTSPANLLNPPSLADLGRACDQTALAIALMGG